MSLRRWLRAWLGIEGPHLVTNYQSQIEALNHIVTSLTSELNDIRNSLNKPKLEAMPRQVRTAASWAEFRSAALAASRKTQ
jgi:hypothetical protein